MFDTASFHDPNPKWWLKSVPKVNNWSDINILRFLRLYQTHQVLWNIRHPEYKNVCSRYRAYKHIVEELNLRYVNVDECMNLVEWLKKRYVEEKEIKRSKCEKRPAWFEIIKGIVKRILNPEDEEPNYKCCEVCCDCETPTDSSISSDYQACKDCCADQNLHPPCEYYKKSEDNVEEEKEDSNRCGFENVECYTMCDNQVRVVLLNIAEKVKKYNSDCDCKTDDSVERNSDCDCKSENSTKKSSSNCDCCKSESLPSVPKSSGDDSCPCLSSSSSNTCSIPASDSLQSVSTVAKFCIQPMPESESNSTLTSSSTSSIDSRRAGIFMSSERFHGKRISLVDEYTKDGRLIAPRLHRARCCCESDFYPLQVEL